MTPTPTDTPTTPTTPHATADRIIYACLVALVVLGVFSFFKLPLYEKGVWYALGAVGLTLSNALGFKFGVTSASGVSQQGPPQ